MSRVTAYLFQYFFVCLFFVVVVVFFYGWEHQGKYYRVHVLSCNITNVWKGLVDIASLSSIPHRFLLFRRTSGIQWWSSPVGKLGSKAKWHKVSKGLMPHFFLSPLTSARIFFSLVDYQNQSHFASLRALIWERLTLLDHQFLYWVPCLFRFQSPWAGFFFSHSLAVDPWASSQTASGALCCARVKCTEAVLALVLQKN